MRTAESDRRLSRSSISSKIERNSQAPIATTVGRQQRISARPENPSAIPWLEAAAATEPNKWVRYTMEESASLLKLASDDPSIKAAAATKLGELRSENGVPALKALVEIGAGPRQRNQQKTVAQASATAIKDIETWGFWSNVIETIFRGISLSSILLIMSLGLAIVFGLMGVINMAHGELMMVGAYATFITQEAFKAFLPPAMFESYFLSALPVAFLSAAGFGLVLEATVIRFLYGRPLETMLATWGVSLVLMQAARVYFGDLTSVVAPGMVERRAASIGRGVPAVQQNFYHRAFDHLCPGNLLRAI